MNLNHKKNYESHGDGKFTKSSFKFIGENVIFEDGVMVFHPENIEIKDNVYIGHNTILKGYFKNSLRIGCNTWIGQNCFFHSAGGIIIGSAVGIGPNVKIITSVHKETNIEVPILFEPLEFATVILEDGCDIGVGSTILPGVRIGKGSIIGAGSVVTRDVPEYTVVAGVPAKVIRKRKGAKPS